MTQIAKENPKLKNKQIAKTTKNIHSKQANNDSLLKKNIAKYARPLLIGLLLAALFYPPYLRGLYFEREQLPTEIIILGIFSLFWVYKFIVKDRKFLQTPIEYTAFGLMAVYLIVIIISVSVRYAVLEWLKYCMYFAVFFMLSDLISTYRSKIVVLWTMIISTLGFCILSIDAAASGVIVKAANQFLSKVLSLDYDLFFELFKEGRLFSTLQYPNAFASYLMAVFFITLGLTIVTSNLFGKAVAGGMNALFIIAFILTQSRGAYVMFPVAILLCLIALPAGKRVQGTAYMLATVIPSLIVSLILIRHVTNPAADKTAVMRMAFEGALISGIFTIMITFIVKWFEKVSWKVYAAMAVIGGIIAAVGLVYVISASSPLTINDPGLVAKNAVLKPDKEYKVVYDVESTAETDIPAVYTITVLSRNENDIIFEKGATIASYTGNLTNGLEKRELTFKVPSDSKIINITIANINKGTKLWLDNCLIINAATNTVEKKLILNYKYIPNSIASRLDDIMATNSGLVRGIYYKDGFNIIKDRWLLGGGGGAWSLLYYQHQSYAYSTTQAHNYFLQVAVECGFVGLVTLILLLAAISVMYLLEYRFRREGDEKERILQAVIFSGIAAMFMHSAIDFDLSLSAVFLLLWQLIGIFNSRYRTSEVTGISEYRSSILNHYLGKLGSLKTLKALGMNPIFGVIISIAVALLPISMVSAKGYAKKAGEAVKKNNITEAAKYTKDAISADPFNPIHMLDYANLLVSGRSISRQNLQEANQMVERAEKISKFNYYDLNANNVEALPITAQYYFGIGEFDKGIDVIRRIVALRPLWPEKWLDKVNGYFAAAMYSFENRKSEEGLSRIDQALKIIDEAKDINHKNMKPFIFNAETQEVLEKMKYIKENITKQKEINIDKVVFYSMPDMDINTDDIPDQWTAIGKTEIKYKEAASSIIAESLVQGQTGIIRTRDLVFQPGKKYRIEFEVNNPQDIKSIDYSVYGVINPTVVPRTGVNVYAAEFTTRSDYKADIYNYLQIHVIGKLEIKNIWIFEI